MHETTLQRNVERVRVAHGDLSHHLDDLAGGERADPSLPSLLPGWTRGHVLTHIARNADSFVRVLTAADRGEEVTQYAGGIQQRNADIADGAGRDWSTLVHDIRSSAAALDSVIATQARWDLTLARPGGERVAHTELPTFRWREVLVHHADIGDPGFTADHWPSDYLREELRRMTMLWDARRPMGTTGLPDRALRAPPTLRLQWLLGRADIDGLEPAGVF